MCKFLITFLAFLFAAIPVHGFPAGAPATEIPSAALPGKAPDSSGIILEDYPPMEEEQDARLAAAMRAWAAWCIIHAGDYGDAAAYWDGFMRDPAVSGEYKSILAEQEKDLRGHMDTIMSHAAAAKKSIEDAAGTVQKEMEELRDSMMPGGSLHDEVMDGLKSLYGNPGLGKN